VNWDDWKEKSSNRIACHIPRLVLLRSWGVQPLSQVVNSSRTSWPQCHLLFILNGKSSDVFQFWVSATTTQILRIQTKTIPDERMCEDQQHPPCQNNCFVFILRRAAIGNLRPEIINSVSCHNPNAWFSLHLADFEQSNRFAEDRIAWIIVPDFCPRQLQPHMTSCS